MKVFFKAFIKSLFGSTANTVLVGIGLLLVLLLVHVGETPLAGWALTAELVLAMVWLAGRYAK